MPPQADITQLLLDWSGGDREALDQLMPPVYTQLRQLAHARLREQAPDHTLNTTALVHEAYIKLMAVKRGGAHRRVDLDVALRLSETQAEMVLDIDRPSNAWNDSARDRARSWSIDTSAG
jgi:hypothetical protein